MPVPLTGKDCLEFENTPFGATQKSPGNARNEKLKKITKTSYTSCVLNFFFVYFCFLLPRRLLFALSRTFPVLTCRLLVKCTMGRLQQLSMRVTSTCSYDVTTGSTKNVFRLSSGLDMATNFEF